MKRVKHGRAAAVLLASCICAPLAAQAAMIRVVIDNLSPTNGSFFTPVWVGFHNGSFDLYDPGVAAFANGLERLAEDGNNAPLSAAFLGGAPGRVDGTIVSPGGFAPVLDPGETTSATFSVDPMANRYFSYASMLIPSNDAFVANGNPLALPIFDAMGNFIGADFVISGASVLDAGTEVNTEMDAAFLNQLADNTGVTENGVVALHPGFIGSERNPGGVPIILGATNPLGAFFDPVAADFTRNNGTQPLLRIRVTQDVPVPATLGLLGSGLLGLLALRRRRS